MNDCVFCEIYKNQQDKIILESDLNYCILDIKPVTKGHILVITKNHYSNLQETPDEYLKDAICLTKKVADYLKSKYPEIKGFNYISNQGACAKQVIFHLHIHIIPRY